MSANKADKTMTTRSKGNAVPMATMNSDDVGGTPVRKSGRASLSSTPDISPLVKGHHQTRSSTGSSRPSTPTPTPTPTTSKERRPSAATPTPNSTSKSNDSTPASTPTGSGRKRPLSAMLESGSVPSTPSPKMRKIGKNNGSGEDNQNDYFCWLCHREGSVVCCEVCPRVYHSKCLGLENSLPEDWVCPECEKVMRAECVDTRSMSMSMITLNQLCMLLTFSLERMKHAGSEPFQKVVDLKVVPRYTDYIFNPMDLGQIEKNIKKKMYGCTEAFLADAKWILHNCIIYNGTHHKLTTSAKMISKICKHEMSEIEICPDCYMNSCMKRNDNWFCEPCRTPHTVVWAKLKGYPFWPAKALRELDGQVDVRFFGAHDRSWVPVSQVFLLSTEIPTAFRNKKAGGFDHAMDELETHINRIRAEFGKFEYAPFRTPYDKNNVYFHNRMKVSILKLGAEGSQMGPTKGVNKSPKTNNVSSKLSSPLLAKSSPKNRIVPEVKVMEKQSMAAKTASALKTKYNSIITTRRAAAKVSGVDSPTAIPSIPSITTVTVKLETIELNQSVPVTSGHSDQQTQDQSKPVLSTSSSEPCKPVSNKAQDEPKKLVSGSVSVPVTKAVTGSVENQSKPVSRDVHPDPSGVFTLSDQSIKTETKTLTLTTLNKSMAVKPRLPDSEVIKRLETTLEKMNEEVEQEAMNSSEISEKTDLEENNVQNSDSKVSLDKSSKIENISGESVSENVGNDLKKVTSGTDTICNLSPKTDDSVEAKTVEPSISSTNSSLPLSISSSSSSIPSSSGESLPKSDCSVTSVVSSQQQQQTLTPTKTSSENATLTVKTEEPDSNTNSSGENFPLISPASKSKFLENLQKTIESCKAKLGIEGEGEMEDDESILDKSDGDDSDNDDVDNDDNDDDNDDDDDDAKEENGEEDMEVAEESENRPVQEGEVGGDADTGGVDDDTKNGESSKQRKLSVDSSGSMSMTEKTTLNADEAMETNCVVANEMQLDSDMSEKSATAKSTEDVNCDKPIKQSDLTIPDSAISQGETTTDVQVAVKGDSGETKTLTNSVDESKTADICNTKSVDIQNGAEVETREKSSLVRSSDSKVDSTFGELSKSGPMITDSQKSDDSKTKIIHTEILRARTGNKYESGDDLSETGGLIMEVDTAPDTDTDSNNLIIDLDQGDESEMTDTSVKGSPVTTRPSSAVSKGETTVAETVKTAVAISTSSLSPTKVQSQISLLDTSSRGVTGVSRVTGSITALASPVKKTGPYITPNAPPFPNKVIRLTCLKSNGKPGGIVSIGNKSPLRTIAPARMPAAATTILKQMVSMPQPPPLQLSPKVQGQATLQQQSEQIFPKPVRLIATNTKISTLPVLPGSSTVQPVRLMMANPPVQPVQLTSGKELAGISRLDLDKYTEKMAQVMKSTLDEMYTDLVSKDTFQTSLKHFQLEMETHQWRHEQEIKDVKHNLELTMAEMKKVWEVEKSKLSEEFGAQYEEDKQKAISETKKKQWCANCGKEAIFYCCWNTSYCDYPCQTSHWPQHMNTCSQSSASDQSADMASNRSKSPKPQTSQVERAVSIQQAPSSSVNNAPATEISAHAAADKSSDNWKERMRENLTAVLKRQEEERDQERRRMMAGNGSSLPSNHMMTSPPRPMMTSPSVAQMGGSVISPTQRQMMATGQTQMMQMGGGQSLQTGPGQTRQSPVGGTVRPGQMIQNVSGQMMQGSPSGQGQMMHGGPGHMLQSGPGQMVQSGPGQMVQSGTGQMVQNVPGKMVQSGPGQMVQSGPGQMVQSGPGQMMQNVSGQMLQSGQRQMIPNVSGQMMSNGPGQMIQGGPSGPPGKMMHIGPGQLMQGSPSGQMMQPQRSPMPQMLQAGSGQQQQFLGAGTPVQLQYVPQGGSVSQTQVMSRPYSHLSSQLAPTVSPHPPPPQMRTYHPSTHQQQQQQNQMSFAVANQRGMTVLQQRPLVAQNNMIYPMMTSQGGQGQVMSQGGPLVFPKPGQHSVNLEVRGPFQRF